MCAINSAGGVQCWGRGGQIGDGANQDSAVPVDVVGLSSGVVVVSGGAWHTCALTVGGAVLCWGEGSDGQLGDGSLADSLFPVGVAGLSSGVVAIAAGYQHTCAVTAGGAVECWGRNDSGQLGDGSTTKRPVPVEVVGL